MSWDNLGGSGFALASDEVYAIFYNATQDYFIEGAIGGVRSAGSGIMAYDIDMAIGDTVHGYLSFRRADGTMVSNSQHISTVVVA